MALSMYEHRKWAPKSACCVLIIDDRCCSSCKTGLLRNICLPLQFIIFSPGLDKETLNLWICNLAITFLRLFIFPFLTVQSLLQLKNYTVKYS